MAYRKPSDLDGFITMMPKADMRVKSLLAEDLVTFLTDETNSIVCTDMGLLVDNLMPWLTGSHFKIAQKSLEAFSELIKRLGPDFNAYTATVLPHVIDRLGDNKDTVREKAQLLLQNLMEYKVLSPQALIDKLAVSCFKHKNAKVREEFLQTIVTTLNEYGTGQLGVRNYVQSISSLLGDPTVIVRDTAIQTLVEIYKHVGDRLRPDLRRIEDLPSTKLALLESKFDQVKIEGLLLPSALSNHQSNNGHDEGDTATRERPSRIVKRAVSSTLRSKANVIGDVATQLTGDAGAVTPEVFEASFEQVPQLTIFHTKDMDDIYKGILVVICDKNTDWEKRVEALKKIRSLIMLNYQSQPQFGMQLKDLSISFLDILKEELRSQVIREACITIAYLSKSLRNKLDTFCANILEQLIFLIQNSAKVISTSAIVALKYIIKYTHAPKIIKIITDMLQQSKSKDIRSTLCELMCLLFQEWQTKSLERHAQLLRDTLKKSISDADSEARKHSRRAYWAFRNHFPDQADQLFGNLDIPTQRALERERNGSTLSLEDRRLTTTGITSRFQRTPGTLQRPAVGMRSLSLLDTNAAQRAKTKKITTLTAPSNVTGSLPRAKVNTNRTPAPNSGLHASTGTAPRPRGRTSQSQPGSRSTSPSSKLREQYGYYRPNTGAIPKKSSGIPRSLANSRETSPTRNNAMKRSVYGTLGTARRTPDRNTPTRPLAAVRMLQQSREAENALADALSPDGSERNDYSLEYGRGSFSAGVGRYGRKLLSRDESDDSEASSVCSERSFDSSYARGKGSLHRLDYTSTREPFEDIETIIKYCASSHWSERKDGLISLTRYLAAGRNLTHKELQDILDLFRKMFMDTHTKVYGLFLDAVNELILAYANDLHDWLFILLTRLFNKLGTELLNSMHLKISRTLDLVHEYFPTDLQIKDVFRILSDAAQTPCTKTKIAILRFLTKVASTYCKSSDFSADNGPGVEKAVIKVVQLASDQKSAELRSQARLCLVALYNLNTPQMTKVLSNLAKQHQDSARNVIQMYMRRSSTSDTNSPGSSPLTSSSPKPLQSPSMIGGPFSSLQPQYNASPRSRQASVDHDLYSEVDVHQNIHKTSEEIRNCFGFEGSKMTRQYHSLSGANPSSNGFNGHLNDQLDSYASNSNSKTQSTATTESNTPESSTMRIDSIEQNHNLSQVTMLSNISTNDISGLNSISSPARYGGNGNGSSSGHNKIDLNYEIDANGELKLEGGECESDIVKLACTLTPDMETEHVQTTLSKLCFCIKSGNCELPNKNFKAIMKMILNLMASPNSDIAIAALKILSRIIRSEKMKPNWMKFLELILLNYMNVYQQGKDVMREVDITMPRIVPALPLDITVNIVNPVIATAKNPVNLCAVKLLTELAERHGGDLTDEHLNNVFPNLARLTDSPLSTVRKAAVFCIVKLYIVMGEEKVRPKLTTLNSSKVRLLNVYIEKQRGSSGGGSSTKNSSASSS